MRPAVNVELTDPHTMALLAAALDSIETTRELIGRIREVESLRRERRDLRGLADLIGETRDRLQSLLLTERVR
jgi:hypothetical protein